MKSAGLLLLLAPPTVGYVAGGKKGAVIGAGAVVALLALAAVSANR
jgi:hypothetical protein